MYRQQRDGRVQRLRDLNQKFWVWFDNLLYKDDHDHRVLRHTLKHLLFKFLIVVALVGSVMLFSFSNHGINPTQPSLTIIQVDNRYTDYQDWTSIMKGNKYWEQTSDINRRYAQKWGYHQERIKSDTSNHLAKVEKTSEFLSSSQSDWILFLDSDAFLSRFEWNLQDVLDHFNVTEDVHMMIENEPSFRKERYTKCNEGRGLTRDQVVNSGVYLIRNTEVGRGIMREWEKTSKQSQYGSSDQGRFNCFLTTDKEYGKHIKIVQGQSFSNISGKRFGGYVDGWTQHYTSGEQGSRLREISNYLKSLQIANNAVVEDDSTLQNP